ncbi:zinc finger BED domain-containing protein 5-like [Parasteatoda tepidariorum]|uniref:zinc finger BED domain-containing protein 5-like n=1 Tax=Parasteatoda tepidariorum TaxID=114398 RepID=UPI0039BD6EA0
MRTLRSRIFSALCNDMGSEHSELLFKYEARCLSREKFLQRVYELREEIVTCLEDNRPETGNLLYCLSVMKLRYLVVIFEKLNNLNLNLQGANTNKLDTSDEVNAFCRKLELWGRNLKQKNLTMFANVDNCTKTYKAEEEYIKVTFVTIENHSMLAKNFKKYFPAHDKLIASYEWIRNPFHKTPEGLSIDEEEKIIDFSTSGETKIQFSNISLFEFWQEEDFSALKQRAFRILLPFSISYLCETEFSAVASLETKYRSLLNIETGLRVAISNIKPRLKKLCSARQAQGSH